MMDSLDSKAGILIAANGVFSGLVLNSGSVVAVAPRSITVLVMILSLLSLVASLIAFANRRYETAPSVEAIVRVMIKDESWLKWRSVGNILEAREANRRKLNAKSRWITLAQTLFLSSVSIAAVSFVTQLETVGE